MELILLIITILLIYLFLLPEHDSKLITKYFKKKYPYNKRKPEKNGLIFVSIASYRDPLLKSTVESLLSNCSDINRLRIVICEQNSPDDDFSLKPIYPGTKILRMSYKKARGPCWARYLIQQEWKSEEYYLQIDSHTRFVKDWDKKLITMVKSLPYKSCLSNYVSTFNIKTGEIIDKPLRGPMKAICRDKNDKFVRFNSKYVDKLSKPEISMGWSGCFSFSSSQIIVDAPYDPYTPFLFFGEEMDIFQRLYTRGWTMYVPDVPICFTTFDRTYRNTFWEHPDKDIVEVSWKRLYNRFGWTQYSEPYLDTQSDVYCLGTVRSPINYNNLV